MVQSQMQTCAGRLLLKRTRGVNRFSILLMQQRLGAGAEGEAAEALVVQMLLLVEGRGSGGQGPCC